MQQRRKAEALLQRYETDLPVQQRQLQERRLSMRARLSERKLSEAEWKALAGIYRREQEEPFRAQIDAYTRRYAAAEKLAAAAKEAIGERPQPDMEGDSGTDGRDGAAASKCAETPGAGAAAVSGKYCGAFGALPKLTKRQQLVEEHARLDTLYRMASEMSAVPGWIWKPMYSGIIWKRFCSLPTADFTEMSASQFELRMYELEKGRRGKEPGTGSYGIL